MKEKLMKINQYFKRKNKNKNLIDQQIRIPLNTIIGLSEAIKLERDLDEIKLDASDIIEASYELLQTVEDSLNIR